MPIPQTPLILVDNVFDRINLYPSATLLSSGDVAGREVQYVADYRRERTYWQAATSAAQRYIKSDVGAGVSVAVNSCWIDRGHNLWGKTIYIDSSTDDVTGSSTAALVVPAQGTLGGNPATGWCVTDEGALYTIFATLPGGRYFRVYVNDVWQPILTGVILGALSQVSMFSSVFDDDAGERSDRSEKSLIPGYVGRDRVYAARKISIELAYIGATEYDATVRSLRRTLFERDQPAVVAMNYGMNPERAWLYQYQGTAWNSPKKGVYRNTAIPMFEVGPLVR